MNKVILMGRLTRDPEVRVSQASDKPMTVGRFSLAVDRKYKREGQPDADFFNCSCFGSQAEFAEKYLGKGTKVVVIGSLQNNNYTDGHGIQRYEVQVAVSEIEFAESKKSAETSAPRQQDPNDGFMNVPDGIMEELPFT